MNYAYQKPLQGKNVGVVLGSFTPLHKGHLDMIMRAKKENEGGCIVVVCGYDGDKGKDFLPFKKRYRYVREYFSDDDMVAVYAIDDSELGIDGCNDQWDIWLGEFNKILYNYVHKDTPKLTWYVGEPEYKIALEDRGNSAVLINRTINPISGTMIRNNPLKYWNSIAHTFKRAFSHNILITGTASEGKSVLTSDIAKYFGLTNTYECPRDYMIDNSVNDNELDSVDFISFLTNQYNFNRKQINSMYNKGVFIADSDAFVTKMYAKYYSMDSTCKMTLNEYRSIEQTAEAFISKSKWDKIFLLSPYGKFIDDNSRYMEHSSINSRNELFDILCNDIKYHGLWDKVTILNYGYMENYNIVKKYIEGVLNYGEY